MADDRSRQLLLPENLNYSAVRVEPVMFDFGGGKGRTWLPIAAHGAFCPDCDAVYYRRPGGAACPRCTTSDTVVKLEARALEPQMNYYYTLPYFRGDPAVTQARLLHHPVNVCLVRLMVMDEDETYALALTGGGMDLSWDICYAYILLGYAPPLHFCRVPEFAAQDNRREPFATILKACLKAIDCVKLQTARLEDEVKRAQRWTGTHYADPPEPNLQNIPATGRGY